MSPCCSCLAQAGFLNLAEAMQTREWEEDPEVSHPWEDDGTSCASDCSDLPKSEKESAMEEFMDVLMSLYMSSVISARIFCVICYWLGKAGLPFGQYGLRPDASSGHYKRHLDKVLGVPDFSKDLYEVPVAGHRKHDLSRTQHNICALPPHEQLYAELASIPSIDLRLDEAKHDKMLPPAYFEHPIVKQSPAEGVLPIALYMDGVPYSHTDSVIGVWICNLLTGVRHLSLVVRKRLVCKCGCRSWCSFFPVFTFLHWSLSALAAGMFPTARHDGTEWSARDGKRAAKAGSNLRKCALLHIKGDWMEYCERLGFPTWRSSLRPCLLCATDPASMHDWRHVSPLGVPFHITSQQDYNTACSRCEIWVSADSANHGAILSRLRYDKRLQGGSKGRALTEAVPGLPLMAGDRLEPSHSLPDVGRFDTLSHADLPKRVCFWRVAEETVCHHRNPLFDEAIGITMASITVDVLHTLHLGVFLAFCKYLIWELLGAGCWHPNQGTEVERVQVAVLAMRSELWRWYGERHKKYPTEYLTRLADLTPKMLGTRASPKLKTKAAETLGLLHFVTDMVTKYSAIIGERSRTFREAGASAIKYMDICSTSPVSMPAGAIQDLFDCMVKHLRLIEGLNIYSPKHHLWVHMTLLTRWHGNPKSVANFLNESDNKTLKAVARGCSQLTFEPSVLFKMREIAQPAKPQGSKRRR